MHVETTRRRIARAFRVEYNARHPDATQRARDRVALVALMPEVGPEDRDRVSGLTRTEWLHATNYDVPCTLSSHALRNAVEAIGAEAGYPPGAWAHLGA